jgi:hypothetical protein
MPFIIATGANTATIVDVVASTASPISAVPSAAAHSGGLALLEVAMDVLDHHDRVVDEQADREAERQHRHLVEREPQEAERPHRRDHRGRQGQRADERGPPVAQEAEDDHDRQDRAEGEIELQIL